MMCLAGCASSVPSADPRGQPPGPLRLHAEEAPPTPTARAVPELVATPAPVQSVFTISMPVYRQVMNLDCEAAALQMALASLGHPYSQPALFAEENADPRLPVMNPDGSVKARTERPTPPAARGCRRTACTRRSKPGAR